MLSGARFRLVVQADLLSDGLVRILGVVAVQPVNLVTVGHDQSGPYATTTVEIVAAAPERAALLVLRLRQLFWVREVGLEPIGAAGRDALV